MNNDADQKIKWREWWIWCDAGLNNSGYGNIDLEPDADADSESLHVIEALPALAEIESLRAENAELIEKCIQYREGSEHVSYKMGTINLELEDKLSAANVQMEKMAEALGFYKDVPLSKVVGISTALGFDEPIYEEEYLATEALTQYEQFKKESVNE